MTEHRKVAALQAHSARMAHIAILHNTRQISDDRRDALVQKSWDQVIADAIRYGFQV